MSNHLYHALHGVREPPEEGIAVEQNAVLEQFHTFYDNLSEGICLIRPDGDETILFANTALLDMYQCTRQDEFQALTGGRFRGMVDPADYHPLPQRSLDGETAFLFFRIRTSLGHFRRLEGTLQKKTFPDLGTVWVLTLSSNLQKAAAMQQDSVTGLMGLHAFYQKARERAIQNKSTGSLKDYAPVYLNLTNFKLYNVSHGLQAGDSLLRSIARTLQAHFPGQLMARVSADSFALLLPVRGLLPTLQQVLQEVDRSIGNPGITLKAGIYQPRKEQSVQEMLHTFDRAQMACDSIKKDATRSYAYYTPELAQRLQLRSFVLENFQKALDTGHIQVYYQPVIRTLTGKLCGLEALARWVDPERGLISPGIFVPVLEETRLIHKLDAYMLEQVARRLHDQKMNHQPQVPISCNFSRLDFILSDPFQLVEDITRKYNLQRNFLCIEVTESALIHDSATLRKELAKFTDAGYPLWLDDFGSAYSSLNVLHNYHFDELKIDMAFWQDLNEKGRKIITSIVLMAKTLGVHTLAEGVETWEQVEFLKEIGCEKIQGYYYGKPQPFDALLLHLQNKGTLPETSLEGPLYEKAGLVNVLTDTPLSLFQYDGEKMTLLFINKAYEKVLRSIGTQSLDHSNRQLHAYDFPQQDKLRTFLDKAMTTTRELSMTYMEGGQYLRFRVRKLAGANGLFLCRGELHNITFDASTRQSRQFDKLLRNLISQYDGLLYLDLKQNTLHVLETTNPSLENDKVYEDIPGFFAAYARDFVHPEDQSRFQAFLRPTNLHRQARDSGRSETADLFRIRQRNGSYKWKIFHAIILFKDADRNILICVREDLWERKDTSFHNSLLPVFTASLGYPVQKAPAPQTLPPYIGENAIRNTPLKYFWKDNCRRFQGASQAFLDYYGLTLQDILGKTDEDMGWHPNTEPFKQDELQVLLKGATLKHRVGRCIVHGVPHTILATKYPLYKENKIVGLLGYFEDADEFSQQKELATKLELKDPETGFLSYRGMLETGLQYTAAWQEQQQDYLGFVLDIPEYEMFLKQYGKDLARHLLQEITKQLGTLDLQQISLARLNGSCFLGLTNNLDLDSLQQALQRLSQNIHQITRIQDCPCTLYLQYALARGSEAHSLDNLLVLLTERLKEAQDRQYGQSIFIGDRIAFDLAKFDTMDELVMISDPETHEMVYMNRASLAVFHMKGPEDYRGKKCYQILEDRQSPCPSCPDTILRQDRFHTITYHNVKSGLDLLVRDTLVPWRGRTLHFMMALNLKEYVDMDIARNATVFREASINDVIALGMRETDPDVGIQRMIDRLARYMGAERFFIFEESPDGTISATYEWGAKGFPPMKDQLQNLPRTVAQPLYDSFDKNQMALIPDVKAFLDSYRKQHPGFEPTVPHLRSLVSGQLTQGTRSLGFTEVVNPSPDMFRDSGLLLATITRFFAIMLRHRNNRQALETSSCTDALTGVGNRYAFHNYVEKLEPDRTYMFLFGDINGLKRENDTHGHKAGDQLILRTARTLGQEPGQVFRMGGDEFVLITPVSGRAEAESLVARIREKCRKAQVSMAMGYSLGRAPITDLDAILSEADHRMYQDKGVMYGRRSTDR